MTEQGNTEYVQDTHADLFGADHEPVDLIRLQGTILIFPCARGWA